MEIFMKRKIALAVFWLIPLSLMALIFFFSSQTAEESTEVSQRLGGFLIRSYNAVMRLLNLPTATEKNAESIDFVLRKCAHFVIYLLLGGSLTNALRFSRVNPKVALRGAFLWCVAYSVSDEIHQWFISGRSAQVRDILIDSFGAFTGALTVALLQSAFERHRAAKNNKSE